MTAPPRRAFVASERRTVEPGVHAPEAIEASGVARGRVIHATVRQHERAEARSLADVRQRIRAARGSELLNRRRKLGAVDDVPATAEVVLVPALLLLLDSHGDVEVEVEIAAERRSPWKGPG